MHKGGRDRQSGQRGREIDGERGRGWREERELGRRVENCRGGDREGQDGVS